MRDGIPQGRARRLVAPGVLGARSAAGLAGSWLRGRLKSEEERRAAHMDAAIRSAEQAVQLMGEMKGAVMKLGQMLSFADASMLPAEIQAVLAQLQADAPPMAWELVEEVVGDELGAHPDDVFERFSRVPIAAASIGQVHSARLGDGTDVVVKVQYPGVADAIAADLRNTRMLSMLLDFAKTFAGPLVQQNDVSALAEELRDRMLEELDYEIEASHQRRFGALWSDDPKVRIPEVVTELTTERVLTQHYHDGMRWAAAVDADEGLRNQWAEVIFRFVFTGLYQHRLFNGDPHPGNYLFHDDGAVTFLDFGCVRSFTDADIEPLRDIAWAAVDRDADRLVGAMQAAGLYTKPPRSKPDDILAVIAPGYAPVAEPQPFTFTHEWAAGAVKAQLNIAPGQQRIMNELETPPQYLMLARISIGMFSVLTGLGASGHWRDLFHEIAPPGDAIASQV